MAFLANFDLLTFDHSLGGTFDRDPRAVVWHTTEGTTVQGAVSVYKSIQACPHLTVDPETFERFQHVPLDRSAFALRNLAGGCQTNTTGVIQIEVVGYAADSWSWSKQRLEWLGEEVLAPILEECPSIPRGPIYTGPRMTCAEWDVWSGGQCGHAHVPENDHWDPGDLDLARIVAYATGDDMPTPEEIWNHPLTKDGQTFPAWQWLLFLHDEMTNPELLEARIAETVASDGGVVSGGATPGQVAEEIGRRLREP